MGVKEISEALSSGSSSAVVPTTAAAHADIWPEGCTPTDIAALRQANLDFACENQRLRIALRFYANKSHIDMDATVRLHWDTVSGEPQNWRYRENEDEAAEGYEDGTIAKRALLDREIDWDGDEPLPIEGEPEYLADDTTSTDAAAAPITSDSLNTTEAQAK
jgi:hypothetical protein